jgi:nucleotide-binding universal stress UspA family protein
MSLLFSKDRVLVPIDFTEEAFTVQAQTLSFVEDASHLYILHVLPRLEPTEPGVIWQTLDDSTRKQNVEKAFFEQFSDSQYKGIHFDVAFGDASTAIVDHAKSNQISLIVIPTHGRSGIWHFLNASIAERVIRLAPCPVLVVRR